MYNNTLTIIRTIGILMPFDITFQRYEPQAFQSLPIKDADQAKYEQLDQELRSIEQFKTIASRLGYSETDEIGYLIEREGDKYWIRLIEDPSDPGLRFAPNDEMLPVLKKFYHAEELPLPASPKHEEDPPIGPNNPITDIPQPSDPPKTPPAPPTTPISDTDVADSPIPSHNPNPIAAAGPFIPKPSKKPTPHSDHSVPGRRKPAGPVSAGFFRSPDSRHSGSTFVSSPSQRKSEGPACAGFFSPPHSRKSGSTFTSSPSYSFASAGTFSSSSSGIPPHSSTPLRNLSSSSSSRIPGSSSFSAHSIVPPTPSSSKPPFLSSSSASLISGSTHQDLSQMQEMLRVQSKLIAELESELKEVNSKLAKCVLTGGAQILGIASSSLDPSVVKSLEKEVEQLKRTASDLHDKLTSAIEKNKELESRLKTLDEGKRFLETELDSSAQAVDELKRLLKESDTRALQEADETEKKIKAELERLNGDLNLARESAARIPDLEKALNEASKLEQEIYDLKTANAAQEKTLGNLLQEKKTLEGDLIQAKKDADTVPDLNIEIRALQKKLEKETKTAREAGDAAQSKIDELTQKIGELEKLISTQNEALSESEKSAARVPDLEKDLDEVRIEIEGLKKANLVQKQTIEKLEEEERERASELEAVKAQAEKLHPLNDEVLKLRSELERVNQLLSEIRETAKTDSEKDKERIDELERLVQTKTDDLGQAEKKANKLPELQGALDKVTQECEELKKALEVAKSLQEVGFRELEAEKTALIIELQKSKALADNVPALEKQLRKVQEAALEQERLAKLELDELKRSLGDREKSIASLTHELASVEGIKQDLSKRAALLTQLLEEKETLIKKQGEIQSRLENDVSRLQERLGQAPTQEQLDNLSREIEETKRKAEKAEELLRIEIHQFGKAHSANMQDLQQELSLVKSKESALREELAQNLEGYQKDLRALEAKYQGEINIKASQYEKLQQKISRLEADDSRQALRLEQENERLVSELRALEEKAERLPRLQEDVAGLQAQLKEANEEARKKSLEFTESQEALNLAKQNLDEQRSNLLERKKEIESLTQELESGKIKEESLNAQIKSLELSLQERQLRIDEQNQNQLRLEAAIHGLEDQLSRVPSQEEINQLISQFDELAARAEEAESRYSLQIADLDKNPEIAEIETQHKKETEELKKVLDQVKLENANLRDQLESRLEEYQTTLRALEKKHQKDIDTMTKELQRLNKKTEKPSQAQNPAPSEIETQMQELIKKNAVISNLLEFTRTELSSKETSLSEKETRIASLEKVLDARDFLLEESRKVNISQSQEIASQAKALDELRRNLTYFSAEAEYYKEKEQDLTNQLEELEELPRQYEEKLAELKREIAKKERELESFWAQAEGWKRQMTEYQSTRDEDVAYHERRVEALEKCLAEAREKERKLIETNHGFVAALAEYQVSEDRIAFLTKQLDETAKRLEDSEERFNKALRTGDLARRQLLEMQGIL